MPITADQSNIQTSPTKPKKRTPDKTYRWWLETDEDRFYQAVFDTAMQIDNNLQSKKYQFCQFARMYNDIDLDYYGGKFSSRNHGDVVSNRLTLNVVQSCVDMAASMIAKNRPKPLFITDGSDYETFLKAEQLTKYVSGIIDDCNIYPLSQRVFTDAGVYGTGALKLYVDWESKQIKAEWVFIDEILVDEREGFREKPAQLHQRKHISRDVLLQMFPDQADKINHATGGFINDGNVFTIADEVLVVESWHLKSGPKAKDGCHSICIENATLLKEHYDKDYYPILFWRWYHQTSGFWGRGITQEIFKIQHSLNNIMKTIELSQELIAVPLIVSPKTAMISEDHLLSNKIGRWVEYIGDTGPQFMTPPAVAPELYQWAEKLEQLAYNTVGLNQNMAQGQKPDLGPQASGAAIRETTDIAAGRLQVISQSWEEWFTEIARVLVDLSKDLYSEYPDLQVMVQDKDALQTINWKDVDMVADKFKIDVFEVSALPTTPAGRLQTITEWSQNGWIPKEQAMSLLQVPDLKRFSNLETATADLTQSTIARIKRDNSYSPDLKPIPQMNLPLALSLATQEIVLAKLQGVPDEILNLLEQYVSDLNYLQQQANPPPAAPTAPGPPDQQQPNQPGAPLPGAPQPPPGQ